MLSSALVAGFAAGLLCALLQYLLVEPDILLAERYESGELVHFQGVMSESSDHGPTHSHGTEPMPGMEMPAAEEPAGHHDHGAGGEETSPAKRQALTVLFAVLTYCGYGLVLLAGVQLAESMGQRIGKAEALLWGLAGFLAFQLMPALGLAPELPGTPAADLSDRQMWWAATAVATILGLWGLAYGKALWQRVVAVAVIAAPHLWGAPEVEGFGGVVPPELAASFSAHSLGVGLVTWAVLGLLTVTLWHSEPAR